MSDLIERLERATGPSAELDARIWCELNGSDYIAPHTWEGQSGKLYVHDYTVPAYTASIDAALTLCPGGFASVGGHSANGATPALALCIAALRARATRPGRGA